MFVLIRQHALELVEEVARGYSWVALVPSWRAGVLLILLTFFMEPSIGTLGMVGAICAWYAGFAAGADSGERPVCVFNGLLGGLFVGHVWEATASVLALAMLGGVFTGWLTVVLGRLAGSLIGLPILSLPFAFVAMLTSAAGSSLSTLVPKYSPLPPELLGTGLDTFLSAFGNLFFLPNPFVGLFVVGILLVFSRYYILLATAGYVAARFWLWLMGAAPEHLASTAWESNAILSALLVGGMFATPSWRTLALATLASVVAGWLSLGFGRILNAVHLVPFSVPFVMASWLVLYAVARNVKMASSYNLHAPDFPERTYERTRIARARMGDPRSVPLAVPFAGKWTVSQGFSGQHTHRGPWRHALDFIMTRDGKSFTNKGSRLEDFFCYNQPVYSPAYGQVWQVVNDVPDNSPGAVNVAANWGNCIVIRLYNGSFALLAHLKPGSIVTAPGLWVKPGDYLGLCGNSGRSPQPHIHMHLQSGADPGSPTLPFHLASVLVSNKHLSARYELATVPEESAEVAGAGEGTVCPFYLYAGRGLRYTVAHNEMITREWALHCEIDAHGRLNLVSSSGGRCIAESTWAVFAGYERSGAFDPYLDLWLLACGFTPASFHVDRWQDQLIPAKLIPSTTSKWLAKVGWPWASFATGDFTRCWDDEAQGWRQRGCYRQKVSGIAVRTNTLILPQIGCASVSAELGGSRYEMQATAAFQRSDVGVPGWESPIRIAVRTGGDSVS